LQTTGAALSTGALGTEEAIESADSAPLSNHKELRRAWFNVQQNGDIAFALEFSNAGNLPSVSDVLSVEGDHGGIQPNYTGPGTIGWTKPYDPENPAELNEAVVPDISGGLDTMAERSDDRFTIGDVTEQDQRITGTIIDAAGVPDIEDEQALSERSVSVPRISYNGPVADTATPVRLQLISGFIYEFPTTLPDPSVIDSQYADPSLWNAPRPPTRIQNPLLSGMLVPSFEHRPHPALTILSSAGGVRTTGFTAIGNWAANASVDQLASNIFQAAAGEIVDALSALSPLPTSFGLKSWVKFFAFNVVLPVGGFVVGFLLGGIGGAFVGASIGLTIGEGLGDISTLLSANSTLGDDLNDTLTDEFSASDFGSATVDTLVAEPFHYAEETPTAAGMAGLAELQKNLVPIFGTANDRDTLEAAFEKFRSLLSVQKDNASALSAQLGQLANRDEGVLLESYLTAIETALGHEQHILTYFGTDLTAAAVAMPTSAATGEAVTFRAVDPKSVPDGATPEELTEPAPPWTPEGDLAYDWTIESSERGSVELDQSEGSVHELVHTFDEPGEYEVRLKLTRQNVPVGSDSLTVIPEQTITVEQSLEAVADVAPSTPVEETIDLDHRGSQTPPDTELASYEWEIYRGVTADSLEDLTGEESIVTISSTREDDDFGFPSSFTPEREAQYTAVLRVEDTSGATDETLATFVAGDPIVATFDTDAGLPLAPGESVTFDASGSSPGAGGEITSYDWRLQRLENESYPYPTVRSESGPDLDQFATTVPDEEGRHRIDLTITVETEGGQTIQKDADTAFVVSDPGDLHLSLIPQIDSPTQYTGARIDFWLLGSDEPNRTRSSDPDRADEPNFEFDEVEWFVEGGEYTILSDINPAANWKFDAFASIRFEEAGEYDIRATATKDGVTDSDSYALDITPEAEKFAEPTDLNGDGRYRDVNGNGELDFDDPTTLYDRLRVGPAAVDERFDYDGDGEVGADDVEQLFAYITEEVSD
jgi:PKD repeat protein